MNKQEILKSYSKPEDKLLVAKLMDKIQFTNTKNQIQVTDFLDGHEQVIAKQVLQQSGKNITFFYGGYEEAERRILFFFPGKLKSIIEESKLSENLVVTDTIKVIHIALPNNLIGDYHHRDYLSGLMKLGIKREKVGDILVTETGADILVHMDIALFLLTHLQDLTRFQKAKIEEKEIRNIEVVKPQKQSIEIVVPQMRLDAIVSELAHVSRTKAEELILGQRVLVNYEVKLKNAILLKTGDLLTIRGKGKFEIGEIISETAKGKLRVKAEKYSS